MRRYTYITKKMKKNRNTFQR